MITNNLADSQGQEQPSFQETIYHIADELHAHACLGLHYTQNAYDRERFTAILTSSARLVAAIDKRDPHEVMKQFEDNLFDSKNNWRAIPLKNSKDEFSNLIFIGVNVS